MYPPMQALLDEFDIELRDGTGYDEEFTSRTGIYNPDTAARGAGIEFFAVRETTQRFVIPSEHYIR